MKLWNSVGYFYKPPCGSSLVCSGVARLWRWARRVGGTEVPQRGPGAEPWRESGGDTPRSQIYTDRAAVKCFSTQVCCRVRPPPLPAPSKNYSDLRESHDQTRPGQAHPCPPMATLLLVLTLNTWRARICYRLETFLRRSAKLGYPANSSATFASICADADYQLFTRLSSNGQHLLHPLLPPQREQHYSFRDRSYNYQLPDRTNEPLLLMTATS